MLVPLFQVDAFTGRPFAGNPAAVCVLRGPAEAGWMQAVAREMNLSETAFLHPEGEGFGLRWFTPAVEVDLCGHATLASAHVLWEAGYLEPASVARFSTRSGVLTARRVGAWIQLDFPAEREEPVQAPAELERALGVVANYVGRNRFDYLVEVASEAALRGMEPDFRRLGQVEARGIIVTCRAEGPPYDFVARFIAPASGIDEDPVTGSAYCCLGPFWQARLRKAEFLAYKASARGGVVGVTAQGDRVLLRGQAVTVLRGELAEGAAAQ
jgi:PhzF family phenazine biosynthesis protein